MEIACQATRGAPDSRQAALRYKIETDKYLKQRGYAYQSIVAFSGSAEKSTAGATVKGYLEALAKGDAAKALSFSNDKPANTEFLTNDILKKQIAKWPITDIKILSDDGSYGFALARLG